MEIKRIGGDDLSWVDPPYSIICSRRELKEIFNRGLDTLEVKRIHGYNMVDRDVYKDYAIIFSSEGELESLKDGLCCDGAEELRQLIRKELSSIKRISIMGKR